MRPVTGIALLFYGVEDMYKALFDAVQLEINQFSLCGLVESYHCFGGTCDFINEVSGVLASMNMKINTLWFVTPCTPIESYQRFGENMLLLF
jgi:hypothetical protein